jgi:hypothetical protein
VCIAPTEFCADAFPEIAQAAATATVNNGAAIRNENGMGIGLPPRRRPLKRYKPMVMSWGIVEHSKCRASFDALIDERGFRGGVPQFFQATRFFQARTGTASSRCAAKRKVGNPTCKKFKGHRALRPRVGEQTQPVRHVNFSTW